MNEILRERLFMNSQSTKIGVHPGKGTLEVVASSLSQLDIVVGL